MEAKKNVFLEERPVAALMRQYALPCVISLLVGALYNIVDQIYIANADYLGAWGNAANTVVFPLTVVALALAVMVGDGCCAYVSLHLGKGQQQTAARSVGGSILLTLGMSAVLTAVYLLFGDSLLALFGGKVSEKTFSLSREYFFYITLGIPFYMFGQAMNPIIRADGSPRFAMISTLAGALLNIVLDPVFIYTFRWGMMGAAVATVLGQILTAALAVWYLCRMKTIRLTKDAFRPDWAVAGRSLSLGLCSFLAQISLVAAMAATNNMLRQYGAQDAVFGQTLYAHIPLAVVGIVMKVFQIVMSVSIGMAAGCIPLVGYNMGAGRHAGCGTVAPAVAGDLRCSKRKCALYGIWYPGLPHIPVHVHPGLCEQGRFHIPAGYGKSSRLYGAVHGAGDPFWRGAVPAAAAFFGFEWRAVLHASFGYTDFLRHSLARWTDAETAERTARISFQRDTERSGLRGL